MVSKRRLTGLILVLLLVFSAVPALATDTLPGEIPTSIDLNDYVPTGITVSPSVLTLTELTSAPALTFSKAGLGSITFEPGLSFIDSAQVQQLSQMESGMDMDFNTDAFSFGFDTDAMALFQNHSATITAEGIKSRFDLPDDADLSGSSWQEHIDLGVIDNAGAEVGVSNLSQYIDLSQVTYNAATDTMTLPVNHFTTYTLSKVAGSTAVEDPLADYQLWDGDTVTNNVEASHIWNIVLNRLANHETINNDTVFIMKDEEICPVDLAIEDSDEQTIIRITPLDSQSQETVYEAGAYTLYISDGIQDINGNGLNKKIKMPFTISE